MGREIKIIREKKDGEERERERERERKTDLGR